MSIASFLPQLLFCSRLKPFSPELRDKAGVGRTGNEAGIFSLSLAGSFAQPMVGQHTLEVLKELDYSDEVMCSTSAKLVHTIL